MCKGINIKHSLERNRSKTELTRANDSTQRHPNPLSLDKNHKSRGGNEIVLVASTLPDKWRLKMRPCLNLPVISSRLVFLFRSFFTLHFSQIIPWKEFDEYHLHDAIEKILRQRHPNPLSLDKNHKSRGGTALITLMMQRSPILFSRDCTNSLDDAKIPYPVLQELH
ncbi:hypothetical protein RRG08_012895 [Elysia crispata]|uniref:Uncharacterized protein n=1 Tax=Elysia crispata TaxID=231223 RepID=A0AAE0YGV8_9GAST|nr:hypothetical protein RRG08_012895 [Elysia crispata]